MYVWGGGGVHISLSQPLAIKMLEKATCIYKPGPAFHSVSGQQDNKYDEMVIIWSTKGSGYVRVITNKNKHGCMCYYPSKLG